MGRYLAAADISASGLAAERQRMEVLASNIANAHTTRTPEGGPYRRQQVVFATALADHLRGTDPSSSVGNGVRVLGVAPDMSELPHVYDPGHPDADGQGFVTMPNVQLSHEMVDMITASRSYEANLQSLRMLKEMAERSLSLLRSV